MMDPVVQGALSAATFALSLKLTSEHASNTPWWRRAAGVGYGAFGLMLGLQLLSSAVPVVKDMEVRAIDRGAAWVLFSISAAKLPARKACTFQYARASVLDAQGVSGKAWWEVLDDPAPGSTRPPGRQWMGDWRIRWDARAGFQPASVQLDSFHDCGLLGGSVQTTSGPFALPAAR